MTRETKIGLFVGMGVIIFMGILISDYLSEAQQDRFPEFGKLFQNNDRPAPQPSGSTNPLPVPGEVVKYQPAPQPQQAKPVEVASHKSSSDTLTQALPDRATITTPKPIGPFVPTGREEGLTEQEARQLDNALKGRGITVVSKPQPAGQGVTHQGVTHQVVQGDTLAKIARQYYGSSTEWSRILEANSLTLSSPTALRIGMKLEIPSRTTAATPPTAPVKAVPQPAPQPVGAVTVAFMEYKLKRGDTLGTVAEKFMGSSKQWESLYALNKERIRDPHRLAEGVSLKVPKKD